MFVIPSDFEGEVSKLTRYAVQHRMMTALANFGGPSGGLTSAGRSSIWSEAGDLLVQLEVNGPGIAVVAETQHSRRSRAVMVSDSAAVWHSTRTASRNRLVYFLSAETALSHALSIASSDSGSASR